MARARTRGGSGARQLERCCPGGADSVATQVEHLKHHVGVQRLGKSLPMPQTDGYTSSPPIVADIADNNYICGTR